MGSNCLIFFFFFFTIFAISGAQKPNISRTWPPAGSREKLTHIHFYFHDIVSGRNPTAITVVQSPLNNSVTGFGEIIMIDDPLTEGPQVTSKLIGRAQGFYASAAIKDVNLLMVQNYVFLEGRYNGSTLSVLGRNSGTVPIRELSIVGGTGYFRMARGYTQARVHFFDPKTGDAVVEYDIYVKHYSH